MRSNRIMGDPLLTTPVATLMASLSPAHSRTDGNQAAKRCGGHRSCAR
jgi:hypothetical protein